MAFNLAALKGLFSKLKPAAKAVANYGDDVAGVVANYGDDAAKALTTYGDDAMRFVNEVDEHLIPYNQYDSIVQHGAVPGKLDKLLGTSKYSDVFDGKASHDGLIDLNLESPGLNIRGKTFHWPTGNSPQDQLKARLMEARSPADWIERPPLPSTVEGSVDASEALDWFTEPGGPWGGVPRTTRVIGDVRGDLFSTGDGIVPGGIAGTYVDVPALPTKGLVMQDTTGLGIGYLDEFGLRPHKNTALGKWFSKQVPAYRWDINPTVGGTDGVASAVVNYGDDAARMAFANADDLAAATAQTGDIAKRIRDANVPMVWDSDNVPDGLDFDIVEKSNDYGLSEFDFPINGARNPTVGNTDELISYLNNADAELDSLEQLDPDAYESGMSWAPPRKSRIVAPELFGGYDNRLVGSFSYPDGFINPDSAAMYYDSLERGYILKKYADAARSIKKQYHLQNASDRAYGLPTLYERLQAELGPHAFTGPNKSDAYRAFLGEKRFI